MGSVIDRKFYRIRRNNISQALFLLQSERLLPVETASLNLGIAIPEALQAVQPEKRPQVLQPTFQQLLEIVVSTHC